MHKCALLPQLKVEHIFENGHMFYVIMVLIYTPVRWMPWSYLYYVADGTPTSDRSKASLYDSRDEAERELDKIVDNIETMHYDTVS